MVVWALVVAPAEMQAHALGRDVLGRRVEHLEMQVDDLTKLCQRQGPELPIPAGAQVRAIELQREAGVSDRLVLVFEDVGERPQVFLVGLIVTVALEARHLSGRYRRHEDLCGVAGSGLKVSNVAPDGIEVFPGNRAVTLGARQLLQAGTPVGGELGEIEPISTGAWRCRLCLAS